MRSSLRTYLGQARKHLQSPSQKIKRFVVGNESADLDSIACALVYGYIQTSSRRSHNDQDVVIPVTNIPAADLQLRPELTALLRHADLRPDSLITLDDIKSVKLDPQQTEWTVVDHNVLTGYLAQYFTGCITGVIDHHEDEGKIPRDVSPRIIEKAGSCSSLVTLYCRTAWDEISSRASSIGAAIAQDDGRLLDDAAYTSTWTAQVAKLAIGAILIDTIRMEDENKVTDHDRKAIRYLEALVNIAPRVGKDYDRDKFYEELNTAKLDIDGLSVHDILRKDYKEWTENNLKLGTTVVVKGLHYISSTHEQWVQDCSAFAKDQKLDLLAITTAFEDDEGQFHREGALFCTNDRAMSAAKKFAKLAEDELKLRDMDLELSHDTSFTWLHAWSQHNLAASRKQVAPLLRKAMSRVS